MASRETELYYNQTFSYEELDEIIEAITLSQSLDEKTAKKLVKKIKEELGTIYYEEKVSYSFYFSDDYAQFLLVHNYRKYSSVPACKLS